MTHEQSLIQAIYKTLETQKPPQDLIKGIGDDCAIWFHGGEYWSWSTDSLVEGTHFKSEWMQPRGLGHKALAASLSDLAAKGSTPFLCTLTLGLPEADSKWLQSFMLGFQDLARRYKIYLAGGDTVRSPHLFIDVAVLGRSTTKPPYRSSAQDGDVVAYLGRPGQSALGLMALMQNFARSKFIDQAIHAHLCPDPLIEEAQTTLSIAKINAMLDLSDDLVSSCWRLAEQSGKSIELNLPKHLWFTELTTEAESLKIEASDLFLYGGEDYGLLATFSPTEFARLQDYRTKSSLQWISIGQVKEGAASVVIREKEGGFRQLPEKGFQHFSRST